MSNFRKICRNFVEIIEKKNNSSPNIKLIESAFDKAFMVFVNRTLLKKDAINLYKTNSETIKDLVLTYQIIENKKNINKETLSIFNVKFDPKKILLVLKFKFLLKKFFQNK